MVIERRLPTPSEYLKLREAVGWRVPNARAAEGALAASVAGVVAVKDDIAVGMARVVGDALLYNLIVDVIVRPAEQRRGIGLGLLSALEAEIRRVSVTGRVQPAPADDTGTFYARAGYGPSQNGLLIKQL